MINLTFQTGLCSTWFIRFAKLGRTVYVNFPPLVDFGIMVYSPWRWMARVIWLAEFSKA